MIENAREVCGLIRIRGKNPKSVWWKQDVKAEGRRKKAAWKVLLGIRENGAKEICLGVYKE